MPERIRKTLAISPPTDSRKTASSEGRVALPRVAPSRITLPKASTSASVLQGQAISRVLRDSILPSVEALGLSRVVLARPHLVPQDLPTGITLSERGPLGPAVRRRGHITNVVARWPEDEMEALRFPCLCFIYEGEADIPIGDVILHCTAGSVILIPSDVPLTQGREAHWCRPHIHKAYSDIFWLHLRPFGAQCHLCHTRGELHESGSYGKNYVVADRQLFPLAAQLIEELDLKRPFFESVGAAHLLTLICLLLRTGPSEDPEVDEAIVRGTELARRDFSDSAMVVQQAQHFIENNLAKPFDLQDIARASYVSRARLAQLFRSELGQTVWEYVTERRLREAKTMLADTDLYVYDVARLSGFGRPSHFFARFAELTGMAPGEFRRQARTQSTKKRR
jgi:AraC-like DNA-binding protein